MMADGSSYSGQLRGNSDDNFIQPIKHGLGLNLFSDGSFYVGEFDKDRAEGQGFYCSADGSIYNRAFKSDVRDGYGEEYSTDGQSYAG